MRVYRHASREGTRGIRSWAHAYVGDTGDETTVAEASVEGYVGAGAQHTGIGLSIGSSGPASVMVFAGAAHVADVWVSAKSWPATKWLTARVPALTEVRDLNVVDVRLHDGALWWEVWHPKHQWTRGTPRWRSGNFKWRDALLGKQVHSKTVIGAPRQVEVPLPEGSYPAMVTIEECRWTRPRWPYPVVIKRFDLDILKEDGTEGGYLPVPGKGENSWDCGPDGVYSMSAPGGSVEEAIGHAVASVLRDRQRHAGTHSYAERINGSPP